MALSKRGVRRHIESPRPLVHQFGHQEGHAGTRQAAAPTGRPMCRGGLSRELEALDLAEAPRRHGHMAQWSGRLRAMMPTLPPPAQLADGALADIVVSGRQVHFPRRWAGSAEPSVDQQYACSYIYARGPRPSDTPFGLLLSGCDAPGSVAGNPHDAPSNHFGHLLLGSDTWAVMVRSFRHAPMALAPVPHKHSGEKAPQGPLIDVATTVRSVRLALMGRSLAYPQYVICTPRQTHVVLPLCHTTFQQLSDHAVHLRLSFYERASVLEDALAGVLFNLHSLHSYAPKQPQQAALAFAHEDVRPSNMLVDLGFGGGLSIGDPSAPRGHGCGRGLDVTLTNFSLYRNAAWSIPNRYYAPLVQSRAFAANDQDLEGAEADKWFEPQRDDLFRLGRVAVAFFGQDTVPFGAGAISLPYPFGDEFIDVAMCHSPTERSRANARNRAIAQDYMQALQLALTYTRERYGTFHADPLCLQPLDRLRDSVDTTGQGAGSLLDLAEDAESFERELAALSGAPSEGMVLRALRIPFLPPGPAALAEGLADAATLRGLVSNVRPTRKHTPFRATAKGHLAFGFDFHQRDELPSAKPSYASMLQATPSQVLPKDDATGLLEKRLRLRPKAPISMRHEASAERLAFDLAYRFRRTIDRPSGRHETRHLFSPFYLMYLQQCSYQYISPNSAHAPLCGRLGIEANFYPKQPLFEPLRAMAAHSIEHSALRRARPTQWLTQKGEAPFGPLPAPHSL